MLEEEESRKGTNITGRKISESVCEIVVRSISQRMDGGAYLLRRFL
jgi:hypothetical protein